MQSIFGYPERASYIECGSGFQPRDQMSRLEAAPKKSLSNGKLVFADIQWPVLGNCGSYAETIKNENYGRAPTI
jgi:hypothetical protein